MAEAIAKIIAADEFEAYSAGTHPAPEINKDAVEIIRELYGVDMTQTQRPKTLVELPPVDVVITMGCGVECPWLPGKYREDWSLDDPTGKEKGEFIKAAKTIEGKVKELKIRFNNIEKGI
jgi:arsenate reductase (thioredoxin)